MAFPKPDRVVYEGWRRSAVARRAWERRWGVNIIPAALGRGGEPGRGAGGMLGGTIGAWWSRRSAAGEMWLHV